MVNTFTSHELKPDGHVIISESIRETRTSFRSMQAGITVALIAVPLCAGIAVINPGVPQWAGILSGVIGGIVVGAISRSRTAVSGPTAGLTAIIASEIAVLGSFEALLLAIVVAGLLQITLGLARSGNVAAFFPTAVIRGLLWAIGLILILKQIPHVLGHDTDPEGEMAFLQPDRENTFSELAELTRDVHPGSATIGLLSIALMLAWRRTEILRRLPLPAPLAVVVVGVALNLLFQNLGGSWNIQSIHLVQLPVSGKDDGLDRMLFFPAFSQWNNPYIYRAGFLIALIASLESLLGLEALSKLDPDQQKTEINRELVAQGSGNLCCGLLGALPVTVEIVRSTVGLNAGGRSRVTAITQGILLLVLALFFPSIVSLIPLSSVAAILLVTGLTLCDLGVFRQMWAAGRYQFLPFMATVSAIIFSDLMIGILMGLAISVAFILNSNLRRPLRRVLERHLGGEVLLIELANQVSFLNRAILEKALRDAPRGTHVLLDARGTDYIDPDVLNLIHEFREITAPVQGVQVSLRGFRNEYLLEDAIQYVDYSTLELQQHLTPKQVLKILRDGSERFRTGHRLTRDLGRQLTATAQGQHPLAVVLSCIDSRTPVELILDLGLGDVFSVRVAGNVISPKVLGSMEYGCAVAGAKVVLVMGHTRCGAVGAAVKLAGCGTSAEEATGCSNLDPILKDIQSHMEPEELTNRDTVNPENQQAMIDRVAHSNVTHIVSKILLQSSTLAKLVQEERIAIVGAMYDVASGQINFIEEATVGLSKDDLRDVLKTSVSDAATARLTDYL